MTDVAPDPTALYGAYVDRYVDAGWTGVLPLPPRKKTPPPDGFTGSDGAYPDVVQLAEWKAKRARSSIALRMPPGVVGIDVDAYGTKPGAATLKSLQEQLGSLPDTWVSTSRTDGVSGIRFFRVPDGVTFVGALPGIEVIQPHHRYAVVWPSIHPDVGEPYRWIDPDGVIGDHIPHVEDLPGLPDAWVAELRADTRTTAERRVLATGQAQPSSAVLGALGGAIQQLSAGTRHDGALSGVTALTRLAHQGHPGADDALATLRATFLAAVTSDGSRTDREATAEWQRMVDAAEKLVGSTPSTRPAWDQLGGGQPIDLADLVAPASGQRPAEVAAATPAADDPWPDPTPLPTRPAPPPWPADVVPPWLDRYATSVATQIGVPVDVPLTIGLGALSAITNTNATIQVQPGWTDGTNLYLAALAPKGSGKSPAAKLMLEPAYEIEAEREAAAAAAVDEFEHDRATLEKRRKAHQDSVSQDPDDKVAALGIAAQLRALQRPPAGMMFVNDITPEALVHDLAANNERMALVDTEGTVLSIVAGRYSANKATNTQLFLRAWSGDDHRHGRVGGGGVPVRLRHPRVVMALAIQPGAWARAVDNTELVDLGFIDRFMVAYPHATRRPKDLRRQAIGPEDRKAYREGLRALDATIARYGTGGAHLHLGNDAIDVLEDFCNDLEHRAGPDGDLVGTAEFVAKVEASVVRLAAILHLAWGHDHATHVSGATMARAARLGHYWVHHHVAAGGDPQVVEDAREVLGWVRRNERATFPARDLQRGLTRFRTKTDGVGGSERLLPVFELLIEHGYLRPVGDWDPLSSKRGVKREFAAHRSLLAPARAAGDEGATPPRHPETTATPQHPPTDAPTEGGEVSTQSRLALIGKTGSKTLRPDTSPLVSQDQGATPATPGPGEAPGTTPGGSPAAVATPTLDALVDQLGPGSIFARPTTGPRPPTDGSIFARPTTGPRPPTDQETTP